MDYERPVRPLYESRLSDAEYGRNLYLDVHFYASGAGHQYLRFEAGRPVLSPPEMGKLQL